MSKQYSNLTTAQLVDHRAQLLEDLSRIAGNIEKNKTDLAALENQKEEARVLGADIPNVQDEHAQVSEKLAAVKKELAENETLLTKIKNDIVKNQKELDKILPILKQHQTDLIDIKTEHGKLGTQNIDLGKEIGEKQNTLNKMNEEFATSCERESASKKYIIELQDDILKLQDKRDEITREIDEIILSSEKLKKENAVDIAGLNAQIEDGKAQLQLFMIEKRKEDERLIQKQEELKRWEQEKRAELEKKAGELSFKEKRLEERAAELRNVKMQLEDIRGKQIPITI